MPWMKIDDSFESHPKVKSIPKGKRTKAIGLWTLAGSWCARHLTDGFVPAYMVGELGGTKAESSLLVSASLWHEVADGFTFHDWTDHQPSRAKVEEERGAAKERMRAARERKKGPRSGNVRANTSEQGADVTENFANGRSVTPTRPDPTRPKDSKSEAAGPDEQREEVIRLCEQMARRLKENGAKNVSVGKAWHTAARLMLDKDGYTEQQIAWLIDKTADDEFWRANVLSMPTLRAKADQLRMKFSAGSNVRQLRTDAQGNQILPPPPSRSPWGQS